MTIYSILHNRLDVSRRTAGCTCDWMWQTGAGSLTVTPAACWSTGESISGNRWGVDDGRNMLPSRVIMDEVWKTCNMLARTGPWKCFLHTVVYIYTRPLVNSRPGCFGIRQTKAALSISSSFIAPWSNLKPCMQHRVHKDAIFSLFSNCTSKNFKIYSIRKLNSSSFLTPAYSAWALCLTATDIHSQLSVCNWQLRWKRNMIMLLKVSIIISIIISNIISFVITMELAFSFKQKFDFQPTFWFLLWNLN